jgi:hypothetical protein
MVREESIRIGPALNYESAMSARSTSHGRIECWHCKRAGHKEENYWNKYPEKRPG